MWYSVVNKKVLLTEKEVANILSVSLSVVRKWRLDNKPPFSMKLNGAVRYEEEEIQDFKRRSLRKASE